MKKAFTMIEVIFVIVIIGLLASVAMPKLAANRDDASASKCALEVSQIIHEASSYYTFYGFTMFKNATIETISNVKTNVGLEDDGVFETKSTKINVDGITYYCAGEALMTITGNSAGLDYNLTIEDKSPSNPIGLKAANLLRETYRINSGETKVYKL